MVTKNRRVEPGYIYHVLNRGSERRGLFHSAASYEAFDPLVAGAPSDDRNDVDSTAFVNQYWNYAPLCGASQSNGLRPWSITGFV